MQPILLSYEKLFRSKLLKKKHWSSKLHAAQWTTVPLIIFTIQFWREHIFVLGALVSHILPVTGEYLLLFYKKNNTSQGRKEKLKGGARLRGANIDKNSLFVTEGCEY